jgi:hypothetical protein
MTIAVQIVNQEPFGGRDIGVTRIEPTADNKLLRTDKVIAPQIAHTFHIHDGVQLVIFERPSEQEQP